MIQDVTFQDFTDTFGGYDRMDNFSYAGLRALYDWLEELSEGTGEEYNLDVIALCVEFTEYENLAELQKNYTDIESMEELEENTTVIPIDGNDGEGFIIQDY